MEAFYANNTMELGKKMSGILYGIGVGPGDPELITLKSLRLIESAEIIAYPKLEGVKALLVKLLSVLLGLIKQKLLLKYQCLKKGYLHKKLMMLQQ